MGEPDSVSGATPVRIGDVDAYESVVIEITDTSPALIDRALQHAEDGVFAVAKWSSGETPKLRSSLYGNNVLLRHWNINESAALSQRLKLRTAIPQGESSTRSLGFPFQMGGQLQGLLIVLVW